MDFRETIDAFASEMGLAAASTDDDVPIKSFIGTLVLARCGRRNMQSLSEALHGADGGHLLQTYRDFKDTVRANPDAYGPQ